MPRAVVISVGNLSLDPIEELVREHAIANATVNAVPNSKINSISTLFEQAIEDSQRAGCIFVNAPQCTITEWQALQNGQILLVYSSPELYLQQALLKDNNVNKTEAIVRWRQEVENVIKLSEQNAQINIVSIDDILANPSSFIARVFDKKVETDYNLQNKSTQQQLMLLASASFLIDQDELYELYDDALSVSIMFGEFSVHLSPDSDFFKKQSNTFQQCAIELMAKGNELVALNETLSTANERLAHSEKKLDASSSELQEQMSALKLAKNKLEQKEAETQALNENVLQLNKELETANKSISEKTAAYKDIVVQKAKVDDKIKVLNDELLTQKDVLSKKQELVDSSKAEVKTLGVQVAQLQEELEGAVAKAIKLEETEKALEHTKATLSEANEKLGKADDESKLTLLQVEMLQEELEGLLSESDELKVEKQQLQQALKNLQEEQEVNNKSEQLAAKRIRELELELEVASLQISQVQEELEHYYLALQNSDHLARTGLVSTPMATNKIQSKIFDKVFAEKISITGQYEAGDYRDVHINLHNVVFPSDAQFANIKTKLVIVSGHVGIEFRAQDTESPLFRVREDATDEYGPYLRYFLTAPDNLKEQQQKTIERLNASERLLIYGVINVIAERLQDPDIETTTNISTEAWRTWRRVSVEFASYVDNLPNWLSFDEVKLREEYVTDGYEHLWLTFSNLLLGSVWRETLAFKVTANTVGEAENGEFSDNLSLEFRELGDGSAPLLTWPPENIDEYGPILTVSLNDKEALVELAQQDSALISHLVSNLPSILDKLNAEGKVLQRSVNEWKGAISAVGFKAPNTPATQAQENLHIASLEDYAKSLSFEELASEGNYQHIVFAQEGNNTKVKLRAENINPETFDAEVYIEFRDGTANVIYHDTEFYGEDSFGPFVKIPAETLMASSSQIKQELELAVLFYEIAIDKINSSENVDELVKSLWANIITQKNTK